MMIFMITMAMCRVCMLVVIVMSEHMSPQFIKYYNFYLALESVVAGLVSDFSFSAIDVLFAAGAEAG